VSGEDVDAILVVLVAEGFRNLIAGVLQLEKALTSGAVHMQYRMRLHLMANNDQRPFEVEL
jgi:hypothetical protein